MAKYVKLPEGFIVKNNKKLPEGFRVISEAKKPEINLPPLSPELRAQPSGNYGNGILAAGLGGLGEGLLGGAESFLNGATLGGYGWLNRKFGGNADKRRQELQALAESEGLGGLNRAADFVAGLGGGLRGASRATAALGNSLLGSRMWNLPAYAASGAADAGIMSAFDNDFSDAGVVAQDALNGAVLGSAFGLGGNLVANPLNKMLSAKAMTKGLKGGLNNVADNPEAIKVLRSGIKTDDTVAQDFLNLAPEALRQVNSETADLVNSSLARRVNVPQSVANQKQKYRDFMEANAGREVVDFSELLPQIHRYRNGDSLPVLKSIRRNLQKTEPDFKFRLDEQGNYDYPHFLKDSQRRQYVHSLASTYRFPDKIVDGINDNQNRQYLLKTFYNPDSKKAVYDVGVLNTDGALLTKFAREGKKGQATTDNILKKGIARTSTGGTTLTQGQTRSALFPDVRLDNNITRNSLVVNPELPHISTLYEGLTPYQVKALDDAIARGAAKTTNKLGTLDSLNRIKQELNADIIGSQQANPANRLSSVDTPDTVALRNVKQRVDRTLGEALKGRDKGYRKAKGMEEAYNAGWEYNPNNVRMRDYAGSLNLLNRNAFAQGLLGRAIHNPLTNRNLAKDVTKYENTLRGILPDNRYGELMRGLGRNSTRYGRLANLVNAAENRLSMPEGTRLFLREQLENPLSAVGAIADESVLRGRQRALRQAAKNLLDPNFSGVDDSWLTENYPALSAYLSGMFAAQ